MHTMPKLTTERLATTRSKAVGSHISGCTLLELARRICLATKTPVFVYPISAIPLTAGTHLKGRNSITQLTTFLSSSLHVSDGFSLLKDKIWAKQEEHKGLHTCKNRKLSAGESKRN